MTPEMIIGEGPEHVYVYYFQSQKKSQDRFPCKIGMTRGCWKKRIVNSFTGMQERPVIGLIIRTQDAKAQERMIHEQLKEHRLNTAGNEWFNTRPAEVAALRDKGGLPVPDRVNLDTMQIGPMLRECRTAAGMSQRELADRVGIAHETLSRIEQGRHNPRWDLLCKALIGLNLGFCIVDKNHPDDALRNKSKQRRYLA